MSKVVIITGGSSGIGLCTAAALRDRGCKVYELSRRDSEVEGITHLRCDITDEEQIKAAVAQVLDENGRIDILINNAGFGISGAVEFTETSDAQRLFDVNFFGMVRMNRAILPLMREQGHGRIVNLSSVAAPVPIPFQTYYSAGKAAVNSYTMALSNEVKPFGITVAAVMPGDIKTGFTAARQKNPEKPSFAFQSERNYIIWKRKRFTLYRTPTGTESGTWALTATEYIWSSCSTR